MLLEPAHAWSLPVAWDAPAGVGAFMSTRAGGVGQGAYDSFNLGLAVGDEADGVAENRRRFAAALGVRPAWLNQVHGVAVVDAAAAADAADRGAVLTADASVTDCPGIACAIQVADCLPVLLAARNGRAVGAAHAGWRGLAAGVVEATLAQVAQLAACAPDQLVAWLGPCIGRTAFEVGAEVVDAFAGGLRFVERPRSDGSRRWLADLPGLARDRLAAAGVSAVRGGHWCTVSETRFFSYRRDRITGRMAAAVWLG
jgi:hypothetical protein